MRILAAALLSLLLVGGCASKNYDQSVVKVTTALGSGSGFYANYANIVITAAHVVGDASAVTIILNDQEAVAKVILVDKDRDIAVLITDLYGKPNELDCSPPGGSDKITIVGHPLGWEERITRKGRTVGAGEVVEGFVPIDVTMLPGDSGAPVLRKGKVVGIAVRVVAIGRYGIGHPTGMGLMVPGDAVCEALERAVQ